MEAKDPPDIAEKRIFRVCPVEARYPPNIAKDEVF